MIINPRPDLRTRFAPTARIGWTSNDGVKQRVEFPSRWAWNDSILRRSLLWQSQSDYDSASAIYHQPSSFRFIHRCESFITAHLEISVHCIPYWYPYLIIRLNQTCLYFVEFRFDPRGFGLSFVQNFCKQRLVSYNVIYRSISKNTFTPSCIKFLLRLSEWITTDTRIDMLSPF